MPTPRQRKLDETELATSMFHENHHQNSVVVEEVGDEIIKQGDDGDNFYVVHEGAVDILVNGTKVVPVTYLHIQYYLNI